MFWPTILISLLQAISPAASVPAPLDEGTETPCAELETIRQSIEQGSADSSRAQRLERGEILVTMREQPGGRLKAGVALFRVDAPAEVVFELVTDHEAFPGTLPYVTTSRLRRDARGEIVYQLLDLPFPITNRYYEIRVERQQRMGIDGRCAESRWSYLEGSGNIDDTFGRWEVVELDPDRTLVAYVAWVDPGGLVPNWAQNWASKRALPGLATAVRDAAVRRSSSRQEAAQGQ